MFNETNLAVTKNARKPYTVTIIPFNHYAKIKRILDQEPPSWVVRRIDEPTTVKNIFLAVSLLIK